MLLTEADAIAAVCEWLGSSDPIDAKRHTSSSKPATTTFLHGHLIDRKVFYAVNALDYWVVTVWKDFDKWNRKLCPTQYKVSWPNEVSEVKGGKIKHIPVPRTMYMSISIWWWNALNRIGRKWFDAGYHSRAARHILKCGVLKEFVRIRLKKPALHAAPSIRSNTLKWTIVDAITEKEYGSGRNELEAWEATAREEGLNPPVEKSRPWRPAIKLKAPPSVNATQ